MQRLCEKRKLAPCPAFYFAAGKPKPKARNILCAPSTVNELRGWEKLPAVILRGL